MKYISRPWMYCGSWWPASTVEVESRDKGVQQQQQIRRRRWPKGKVLIKSPEEGRKEGTRVRDVEVEVKAEDEAVTRCASYSYSDS